MAVSVLNLCTPCTFVSTKGMHSKDLGPLPLCCPCLGTTTLKCPGRPLSPYVKSEKTFPLRKEAEVGYVHPWQEPVGGTHGRVRACFPGQLPRGLPNRQSWPSRWGCSSQCSWQPPWRCQQEENEN